MAASCILKTSEIFRWRSLCVHTPKLSLCIQKHIQPSQNNAPIIGAAVWTDLDRLYGPVPTLINPPVTKSARTHNIKRISRPRPRHRI